MASKEDDFPRGGKKQTTTESRVKPVKHPEVDNLFKIRESEEPKKRKRQKGDALKKDKKQKIEKEEPLKLNKPASVDILQLKSLKVGTLMLGCVKEVTDFEVIISLPSGLLGYLNISNICDAYTKILSEQLDSEDTEEIFALSSLFSAGMLVRCVVARLDVGQCGSISIQLSVNPKEVNKGMSKECLNPGMTLSGFVASIEEHGYLVDLGIKGNNAFLPKHAAKDIPNIHKELMVGQYLTCILVEVKSDGAVVRLSVSPSAVAQSVAETEHGWTLTNLLPGLLVTAEIKKVTLHGLIIEFLSSFTGMVDFMHFETEHASPLKKGDIVKACVLHVEPTTRQVGLSLRNHLLQTGSNLRLATNDRIGEVVHGCKLTAHHSLSGAILELPDQTVVFVHRNHMKEPEEELNLNRVLAKPEHVCRIMDFSPLEQLHLVSLRRSIINAPYFRRYHDMHPGLIVEGKVMSLYPSGIMVKVSDYVRGLVPHVHLADVILKKPEKKYVVGMNIKCRVLSVDVQRKKLTLTRKRALLESTLPLFRTYEDARPGLVSHGFIVCIQNYGCIVRFYGDVKGLVPQNELCAERVVVPQSMFYVGQVVKAKVLKCEDEKLLLSLKAVSGDCEGPPKPKFKFEVGKVVEAKVLSKVPSGLEVSILPEEATVLLPTMHLSDHVSNCHIFWKVFQEGDIISDIVCVGNNAQNVTMTKKPTVKCALEEGVMVARDFSEITVGMQLIGWIMKILPYGVFVQFPCNLVGLAPKAAMSDRFVSDTAGPFQQGQTVVAKVTHVDEEKRRFLVTLKVSEVSVAKRETEARLLQGYQERKAVIETMTRRDDSDLVKQLSAVRLGQRITVSVEEVLEDGSVTLQSEELSEATVVPIEGHVPEKLVRDQKCTAVILYADLLTSQVFVSLLAKLTSVREQEKTLSKQPATVLHTDQDFAIISLDNSGQLTVIETTHHLNEATFDLNKLTAGQTLTVFVKETSCENLEGLPLVAREGDATEPHMFFSGHKSRYHFGDVVKAKVKAIKPTCLLLTLEDKAIGIVHVSEIEDVVRVGTFPTNSLKIGTKVTARVIGGRERKSRRFLPFSHRNFTYSLPELTLRPSKLKEDADNMTQSVKRYQVGDNIICFVSKFCPIRKCLELTIEPSVMGTVELLAMISDPKEAKHLQNLCKLGQAVSAKVVSVCRSKPSQISLSLNGVHKLEMGSIVVGKVQKIDGNLGLLVQLPFNTNGTVALEDLFDSFRKKPLATFKKGGFVRCCIVGQKNNKWQLSLRLSRTNPDKASVVQDPEIQSVDELTVGQVLRGYVKNVTERGVLVSLSRSIQGLVQFRRATKYFLPSHQAYAKYVPENSLLTAKVFSIDKDKQLIELSLLEDDTGKPDVLPASLGLPLRLFGGAKEQDKSTKRKRAESESKEEPAEETAKKSAGKTAEKKEKKKAKKSKVVDSDSGVEVYFREEEDEERVEKKNRSAEVLTPASAKPATLQVAGGFSWDVGLSSLKPASTALGEDDSSDGEEEQDKTKPQKRSRHDQETEKREAEKALTKLETELMDPGMRPQTAASFERLLLSSPDSSLLWLQYMAFHLQATQIDQARAVAERALKTINFREDREKLNVWVALMNLENLYGTAESLQKVFDRATQYCEPIPVYQQLADIYHKSEKTKEADRLYQTMVKRFRQETSVWLSYGTFLLQQGQSDAASALLQRAIKSLPTREHVDVICKFAKLELRYGDVERGKAMFDKVLSSYPKRTDLWSVFIDLLIKHGSQNDIRALFDRVIHLSVAVKKIKFFFKRYLDYEKKHGTPESVLAVKLKAMEYVESKGTDATG
ncbi:hypothetical protein UPYG_G00065090 [Umbra pygmaea]|uniref:Protein RRP5 homolog n=1 Tax=Umbra pygmaea TaxID=75934 RepID=A0ABD0XA84_UMBPY